MLRATSSIGRRRKLQIALCCMLAALHQANANADSASAANDQVLQHWAQATGMSARLVPVGSGETELQWAGLTAADAYQRNSSGGDVLTPYNSGEFYALRVQADGRASSQDGDTTWAQLALTSSNDRSLIPHPEQIGSLQLGHAGSGYRFALGDVAVQSSTLGLNTALRGINLQRELGATLVSGSAGIIADSWEGLGDQSQRQLLVRNALALSVQRPFGSSSQWFATLQGYDDDPGSLDAQMQTVLPASGRSTTAGFSTTRGRFTVSAEGGLSQFREQDSAWRSSAAGVIDGQWSLEQILLRVGHHDFGRHFTSLAAGPVPGLRETYVNGTWSVASYATLSADVRQTRNRNVVLPATPTMPLPAFVAPVSPLPAKSNSGTLQANIEIERVAGLSVLVLESQSRGENSDGGRNDARTHSLSVNWARTTWSLNAGFQQSRVTNAAALDSSGTLRNWNASLTRSWTDASQTLTLSGTLITALQLQSLDSGARARLATGTLRLAASHARAGSLSAGVTLGRGRDVLEHPLKQRAVQIDAERAISPRAAIKIYYLLNQSNVGVTGLSYREQLCGLQVRYAF